MKKMYQVSGMTCGGCVKTVKAVLGSVPGVSNIDVSLETQTVQLDAPAQVGLPELQEKLRNFPYRLTEKEAGEKQ
ncbi:MAG: heavy-metal-associated domain-containing protein [Bacteroidetes bacterium]|nr:heavy-metal-associated domain-containing protein [Bacteroidota bacterium]MBS1977618.1 heavy-metal-associated domain-containing protein [Bacteroidota bacterium]